MSDLGTARGRIVIDTSGVRAAQAEVQSASKTMSQALGAVGISLGAAQFARFAVEADKMATAYRRQSVAARELAGGQAQLNSLLSVYESATGGAVDKATALADVTRLLSVGFADSAEELDRFVRAARGIAIATGQTQDYVISQLQLAIANQSTMRLDQLGLGVSEVKQRIDELKASNKSLTDEMAYQQAILEAATKKFGALTDSAEAQATGIERLRKAWAEFQLQFGQDAGGGVNIIFNQWASDIERATRELQQFSEFLEKVAQLGKDFRISIGLQRPDSAFSRTSIGRVTPQAFGDGSASGPTVDQKKLLDAQLEFSRDLADINRDAARAIQDATEQYGRQRAETIRQYELGIVREAEDFARQRARQQRDHERAILQVIRDSRERETEWAEDLAEKTADVRRRSSERIAEMEADFAKRRERAQTQHRERLQDAAARLDAVAVYNEQKNFARSQREAEEDQRDRLDKERKQHDESIAQANKAHQKRLEDARKADARRLEDMRIALERQRADENEDRAIRKARAEEDHRTALAQQDAEHARNLARIAREAAEQRALRVAAFNDEMIELGLHNVAVEAERKRAQEAELKAIEPFTRQWFSTIREAMEAVFPSAGHPSNADPYINRIAPSTVSSGSIAPSGSRAVTFAQGAIVINGDGMNERQVAQYVYDLIMSMTRGLPR